MVGYYVGEGIEEGALRRQLATTLPEYMVPAALVRTEALPLTPNGKVDRRALPAPEAVAMGEGALATPRDELERQLVEGWSEVLRRPVGIHENFFELGGHSLLAIRLLSKLKALTGRSLPVSVFFQGPTVAELASYIRRAEGESPSSLVPIQTGGGELPLFLIHGGTGQILRYREVGRGFAGQRPVYGLQSVGLDGEEAPYTRITDMAAHYLRLIREQQARGPYHLAGWSMGGLIAYEMACQLQAVGEEVAYLGVLDAHFPTAADRAQIKNPFALLATFAQDFGLDLRETGLEADDLQEMSPNEQVRAVLERARAAGGVPADLDVEQIQRFYEVFRVNSRATLDFVPGSLSGPLLFYQAEEPAPSGETGWLARLAAEGRRLTRQGLTPTRPWRNLVGDRLVLRPVPGHHFSMLGAPHAETLAKQIHDDLEAVGGKTRKP
jgi:thioesterase domain-containing protein/acyl carrier protein